MLWLRWHFMNSLLWSIVIPYILGGATSTPVTSKKTCSVFDAVRWTGRSFSAWDISNDEVRKVGEDGGHIEARVALFWSLLLLFRLTVLDVVSSVVVVVVAFDDGSGLVMSSEAAASSWFGISLSLLMVQGDHCWLKHKKSILQLYRILKFKRPIEFLWK